MVIGARRKDRLDKLAADLTSQGHEVAAVAMDVSDTDSIAEAFDAAEVAMGGRRINLLINNAGIAAPNISLKITPEEWDSLMGTNLRGAFFVAQAFSQRLVEAGSGGSIINISSILGQRTGTQQSSYGAAKAALDQLTRVMAMELARNDIRVNGMAPGCELPSKFCSVSRHHLTWGVETCRFRDRDECRLLRDATRRTIHR